MNLCVLYKNGKTFVRALLSLDICLVSLRIAQGANVNTMYMPYPDDWNIPMYRLLICRIGDPRVPRILHLLLLAGADTSRVRVQWLYLHDPAVTVYIQCGCDYKSILTDALRLNYYNVASILLTCSNHNTQVRNRNRMSGLIHSFTRRRRILNFQG